MKQLTLVLALLALVACKKSEPELAENIQTANEVFAPQLLRGFYPVEEGSWRWTQPSFAVALKPPRKVSGGAILVMQYSLPQAALDKLKEVTVSASIDGIPLQPDKCNRTGLLELRREIPADALMGKTGVKVEFTVSPYLTPTAEDRRDLGVIVHSVGLVRKP
jgi:hypothetical protein